MTNIVFYGGDLNKNYVANTELCTDMTTVTCKPITSVYDSSMYLAMDINNLKWSKPEGMFHMEWLIDYDQASIPTITVSNC